MARRLDYEKARQRDKAAGPADSGTFAGGSPRQKQLARFVATHGIVCFKCRRSEAQWAKTGVGKRGPWAICVRCVRR